MKHIGVLPDKWEDVAHYRYQMLRVESLKGIIEGDLIIEGCVDCPCLVVNINGNYIVTGCRVTKCIKQYPHKEDNEEFK